MRAILAFLVFAACAFAAPPYRFLLVIGNQWEDDASFLIERPSEFQVVAALLKTWGLPFDILRLDQQRMDRYHLLERDGTPRYGTIVWDAPAEQLKGVNLALLEELSAQGVALVALGDTVAAPEVARLAGLRYVSEYKSSDTLAFAGEHFITRSLAGREKELTAGGGYSVGGSKVAPEDATVVARHGQAPFLTVRQAQGRGRVVWLGAERSVSRMQNQLVRDLLKRSLVWAQGYAVYAEYDRALILFMDDPGTPDKTFLPYWHYQTPSEERIRTGMIEPLQRRGASMDVNVNTGYVDRKTERVVNPWRQRVVDEIDGRTIHDFASTQRGLAAGVAAGVFFIQSHGWTHMLPDLDSPPGPFWNAPMDGVGSLDWYNEFGDGLRKREVPAVTQRLHLERALECIREDFGVRPQVVRPGGGLYSRTGANNTSVNAARMGFGIATWNWAVYLGPEMAISLESVSRRGAWDYDKRITAADLAWTPDAPFWLGFHDRDLALDPPSFERLLTGLGAGIRYMNGSEYSAYLHAKVRGAPGRFTVEYDSHYCAYFASHPSRWTVHLADDVRGQLPEKRTVEVPKGLGAHAL
jgi:peptidoglycan/xylan/chitin deacetylase (PgdA/CDA1 family)